MKKFLLSILIVPVLLGSCTSDRKSEKKEKEIIEQQIKEEGKSSNGENLQKTQEKTDIFSKGNAENQREEKNQEKSVTPSQKDKKSITESLKEGIGVSDDNVVKNGKVFNYQSEKGEKIKVIFKTYDDKRNYIIVERPGKPKLELDQDEAWAKGAIYKRDTIRMDFDFAKATLIIGDGRTDYVGDKEISN